MPQANHPPQPPTKQDPMGVSLRAFCQAKRQAVNSKSPQMGYQIAGKTRDVTSDVTKIQPLRGALYAVGVTRVPRPRGKKDLIGVCVRRNFQDTTQDSNSEFPQINVIERVRFLDADGVMVNRIILDVGGLIVQIVAHDDSPRTVIVMIGEDVRMMSRATLIFIFFHLAKRMQHEHAQKSRR